MLNNGIPIGTFLAKVQYAESQGKLEHLVHDDPIQPFHFAVLKDTLQSENEEVMVYQVSTFPDMRKICLTFHAMRRSFKQLFNEEPDYLESNGLRAVFRFNNIWKKLLIIVTNYKFPKSFLFGMINRMSGTLSALFEKTSYKSAQFARSALICFSKNMNNVNGVQSVLATLSQPLPPRAPQLSGTDKRVLESGPGQLILAACEDPVIFGSCSVFVYGRCIFTTMNDLNLWISELIVANQRETTEEYLTIDGRLFCIARHNYTTMVSITAPSRGLEICCKMQVVLMRLDSKNFITKFQGAFANILPPFQEFDALVTKGPFKVSQPPFVCAPLFVPVSLTLRANAIASLMYESCSNGTNGALISYKVDKMKYRLKFVHKADSMVFWIYHVPKGKRDKIFVHDNVVSLPHFLSSLSN
ncbi:hypothetical protein TVAG_451020 [Trichomonas vaginalis G3]|uniref:Uncharacterized protein n=1 Tax=Trichomonas vaginalis (strain ATCC PRA-98 / G3) TaxID=412133 RepID=A2EYQ5_TRIV3|nr:hypothetical protein TVAGG3_0866120 [Trichomonas vaginalis G3]EAY02202.1 hypothetical protein TVAG_451020 [Trichomonas vaginalis G3]KAI5501039.1 hypothetical protein TVAGG3_0866120 [Trichomonas vaginalis G3]|eukprot:XP_001314540.1 hypothetical protein [Trichomonas vaginalis G3]